METPTTSPEKQLQEATSLPEVTKILVENPGFEIGTLNTEMMLQIISAIEIFFIPNFSDQNLLLWVIQGAKHILIPGTHHIDNTDIETFFNLISNALEKHIEPCSQFQLLYKDTQSIPGYRPPC